MFKTEEAALALSALGRAGAAAGLAGRKLAEALRSLISNHSISQGTFDGIRVGSTSNVLNFAPASTAIFSRSATYL